MSGPPDVPGGSIVTAEQHTRPLRMAHIQGTTGTASFFKNSSPTHGTLSTVLTQPATAAPCSSSLSSSTLSPTLLFKLHTPPFGIHQPASILLSGFSSTSPSDSNKTAHPAHKPLARLFHSTISSLNKLKQQLAATVDPSAPHWTHRARQTSSRRQSQRELDDSQQHPPHAGKSRPTHHRKLSPHQEAQLQERLGLRASQECRIMDAIAHFQKAAAADPGNAKVLALLSKQWTDLTYAQGAVVEVPHAHHCNSRALEYAEAAVAADPRCMSARVACCVSKGRLALFVSDARTKVKLACDAQSDVKVAIELDPSNDTAHHLMGRWNYEMVQGRANTSPTHMTSTHWANRMHTEDAAAAIVHLLQLVDPLPLYIGADDTPLPLDVLYDALAKLIGAAAPPDGSAPAGIGSKRLSSARLRESGFVAQWPDSRRGYAALLALQA
ncbi:MAG: hypothetical protein WDW38_009960 [Sanguina aurantia]